MSKADPIEQALNEIAELRFAPPSEQVVQQLRGYLKNKSNLVVAKAAKVAGELRLFGLIADLVAAFSELMVNPAKLDKRCAAITEIVSSLYELDYTEPEVYLQGIRHVQKEASFGPPVDEAATLRGRSAQACFAPAIETPSRLSLTCSSMPSRRRDKARFVHWL